MSASGLLCADDFYTGSVPAPAPLARPPEADRFSRSCKVIPVMTFVRGKPGPNPDTAPDTTMVMVAGYRVVAGGYPPTAPADPGHVR